MSLAQTLLDVGAAVARGFADALRARDEAASLEAARATLLNAVAEVESAAARAKFPELRES